MRRPRFKLDGRVGTLRSTKADGSPYLQSGRLTYIWDLWLQSVLAGTAESTAEISRVGQKRTWHPIEATPTEIVEYFRSYRLGGALRIKRCIQIRERRQLRDLPVTNPEWRFR